MKADRKSKLQRKREKPTRSKVSDSKVKRKQTEDALQEAEIKYRMLVERLPVAIYTSELGVNGAWHYISPQIERLLGFTADEWMADSGLWYRQIHPDDRDRQEELEEQAWARQESFEGEYRMLTRDGRLVWIRDSAQILPPQNDGAPIVQGVLMDVTERKFAEDALAASEAELRALFISMQDVVLVIDRDGVYRKIAPTNPNLLYKPSQEMLGKNLRDLFPAKQADIFKNAIQQALMTRQTIRIEYSLSIGSHLTWFAASISPMDADNTLWVARDITEHKQAEQMQALLYEIANVAQTAVSLNDLYASIHKALGTFMPADNFYIAIYDVQNDLLSFPYFVDQYDKAPVPQKPGNGLTEYVLRTRQPLLSTPQVFEEMIKSKKVDSIGIASIDWIGVPLTVANETFGVMVVQTYADKPRLTQRDLHLLTFVSTQAAMVIKRKQVEQTLLQFREVMNESNDAIFFVAPETSRYLDFNKIALEFLGYNKEELSQLGVIDIAQNVNSIEEWRERVDLVSRSNGLVFQTSYRRKNDTLFPVEVSARILDYDGKPIIVAVVRDITERMQAETARERQLQELTGLHAIASACAFANEEDALLNTVSILIGEALYPEDFGFFMADKTGLLHPHSFYHQKNGTPNEAIRPGEGFIGQAAQEGKAFRTGDVRLEKNYIAASPTSLSELAVPVKINDRILGVINAESNKLNAFSEADERLLNTAADQIATALERIRLQDETEQRAREFASLYETSKALSAENDLNTLLRSIVENARKLLKCAASGMYLTIPGSVELELSMDTAPYIPLGSRLKLGEGVAGRVAQTRQPLRIDNYSTWEGRSPLYEGATIRAVLEVPMLYKGGLIGVLTADEAGESERKFTEADEHLLSLFASQAAGAIHSARLFEETRHRAEEFAGLYQTTRDLSIQQDLPTVLTTITQQATTLLNVPNASITLYDPTHADLELVASIGPDLPIGTRRKIGDGLAGRIAQTRAPIIIEDYQRWEHRSALYDSISYTAMMGVPLLYGGNLLGVLDVSDVAPSTRTFNEADVRLLSLFAGQAASAIANTRLFQETVRRLENLQSLRTIDNAISGSADVGSILEVILGQVISQLGADAAVILLFNPLEQILEYAAGRGFRTQALRYTRLTLGEGYAGRVAQERKTKYIPDIRAVHTDFLRSPTLAQERFISYYGVPLIAKGEIKGVLEVFHRAPFEADSEWLNFLETLSGQTAIAIDNTALYKGLQLSNIELTLAYDATIEGWSRALDLRDKETEGHTQRVTEITLSLAKAMDISEVEMVNIRRGALLHDIGKMGVPDSILLKPGELTNEEWEVMRKHPIYAYEMLTPIAYLKTALDIPYCHHEKWDGTGYPNKLKGEDIPLAARIFAVVDVWDAIRSDRPYRQSWNAEKAIEYIKSQSGRYFDPEVVKAFLNLLREE